MPICYSLRNYNASNMASWREFLDQEGYENLSKAKILTDVTSKDDPEDDPFKSLYEARDHYKSVQKVIKKWADKRKVEDDLKFLSAAVELRLGNDKRLRQHDVVILS